MAQAVVWDWNGTLLDDLECVLGVTNQLLTEFGLPRLRGVPDYHAVFRFPVVDYYADLGFDTAAGGNFEAASVRYIELYLAAASRCVLHPGAVDALTALHAAGRRQVLVSASEQQNLTAQLAPFGLDRWLDGAYGLTDIYAASKLAVAKRWLEDSALDASDVLFVGDSEHDFEIADALGAPCVLFSGGHHAKEHLASLGVPVVDNLRDIVRFAAA
jgi:phosphoglycolate phosphatase